MLKCDMIRQGNWLFRWRSYLPLLLLPVGIWSTGCMMASIGQGVEDAYDYACLALAAAGLALRVATVGFVPGGTSGRNSYGQKALALNTTGLYSVVRHPLYVGNFLIFLAFALLMKSAIFVVFCGTVFAVYYERIMLAEEEFLLGLYGDGYVAWANSTPAVVPRLSAWRPPALPFSWRSVIAREHHTVFLICGFFFAFEIYEAVAMHGEDFPGWLAHEPAWALLLAMGGAGYLVVRVIRKRTRWLVVVGR